MVDLVDTHIDMKDNLIPGRPVIVSKKNGALYYDRMCLFTHNVKDFIVNVINLPDDNVQTTRRAVLFVNALASVFLSIPAWSFYFKDMNPARICNKADYEIAHKFIWG